VAEIDWLIEPVEARHRATTWWTVEHAAYVAVGLLAAALRFLGLGLRPLVEGEAAQALAAYRFVQGSIDVAPAGTIPALFTGNTIAFTLLGGGDWSARLLPALAGLALVLLPYGLRHRLGRGGALAASLLLALSPSAAFFSRSVDGAVVVAACGLAALVGLIRYVDLGRPRDLYLAAGALGLGLASGPEIYFLLLIWIAFGLLLYVLDRKVGWPALVTAFQSAWGSGDEEEAGGPSLLARAGAVLATTFALVATALVLHPAGVGLSADLFSTWLRRFLPEAGGQPAIYPLLLLLRYEALILFLGLLAVSRWAWGRPGREEGIEFSDWSLSHTALFAFWAGAALLLVVVAGHRPASYVLLAVVPLALLGGQALAEIWQQIDRRVPWGEAALVAAATLGVGVFIYLQVAAYSQVGSAATMALAGMTIPAWVSYLLLALVALLLLVGLGAGAWIWRGPRLVWAGGWLALTIALALFGFKALWSVNFAHASDPRELMLGQATSPQVRTFVAHMEELSRNQAGDAHTLAVTVEADTGPVVAWYLREFGQQTVVEELAGPPETMAAVTLARGDLPIGETYRGQGYELRSHWLPWGLWGADLVQWLLFTEGSRPVVDQKVVLWVASE
jgi:uncharacterized protein (TIGR03663 family)